MNIDLLELTKKSLESHRSMLESIKEKQKLIKGFGENAYTYGKELEEYLVKTLDKIESGEEFTIEEANNFRTMVDVFVSLASTAIYSETLKMEEIKL